VIVCAAPTSVVQQGEERGTSILQCNGADAGWKPGESKIVEKSSLLSDDKVVSSSEDRTKEKW